jgi:predicted short-subunit dehydrogenase-like oxidoreductase (DUF2520 family)
VTRAVTVVVGRGRLGRALATALAAAGVPVRLVAGRARRAPALDDARVVVLAVPDPAIAAVAERLRPALLPRTVLLHTAGRVGPEVLRACVARGVAVGVFHPLVSLSTRRSPDLFRHRTIVCDGDARALEASRRLARALGAHVVAAPVHGAAYHAAAVLLTSGAVTLVDAALGVLAALDVPPNDARRALAGLLASVAANLDAQSPADALTGPFARGDGEAVSVHRAALASSSPEALRLYDALAPDVLALAVRAGLDAASASAVSRALVADVSDRTRARRRPARRSRA